MDELEKLDHALRLYAEDKLFQAARVIEQVKSTVDVVLNDKTSDSDLRENATKWQQRLNEPELRQISAESAEVNTLKESLESKIGWTPSYDGAQTKVWYRKETDTSSHSFLVEGDIQAPLLNLAALLYEADLYPELLWFVKQAVVLQELGRVRRSALFTIQGFWPLYDREVAVYGYAVDGLDEDDNCVLVMSRSLRDSDGVPIPENLGDGQSRTVRVHVHVSGYVLLPQTPTTTRVRFVFNVDPKLAYVPTALVNWASRTLCRWSLRALESRARNLPESYQVRMKDKQIYKWFSSRLLHYWTLKGKAEEYRSPESAPPEERRLSGNFDINAPPEAPPRSVMASLLSRQSSAGRSADSLLTRGKSLASRFFSSGSERE